jgi:hypothetical protein
VNIAFKAINGPLSDRSRTAVYGGARLPHLWSVCGVLPRATSNIRLFLPVVSSGTRVSGVAGPTHLSRCGPGEICPSIMRSISKFLIGVSCVLATLLHLFNVRRSACPSGDCARCSELNGRRRKRNSSCRLVNCGDISPLGSIRFGRGRCRSTVWQLYDAQILESRFVVRSCACGLASRGQARFLAGVGAFRAVSCSRSLECHSHRWKCDDPEPQSSW